MSQCSTPTAVCVSNGEVFIADTNNHRVRKILRDGQIVTIAGTGEDGYNGDNQPATSAQLCWPIAVFVSSNQVYISEGLGNRVRKILQNGMIQTIAGNGKGGFSGDGGLAVNSQVSGPRGLFVTDDEEVYISDNGNHRVRKIGRNGIITTIAGTGIAGYNGDDQLATNATLYDPQGIFVYENEIYISDMTNKRVRKISQNGMITSISAEKISTFSTIVYKGEIYISGFISNEILKYTDGRFKPIIGYETPKSRKSTNAANILINPAGLWIDDSKIYIADFKNHRVLKVDEFGKVTTIAGTGKPGYSGDVPFDFDKYPHIGPKKKQLIKPFPRSYHDLIVSFNDSF